jgi:hypothetical protein
MYNDVFKSLNESIKRRNTPSDYIPVDVKNIKDVIHRGYLKKSLYPIRYDMIPDGKTQNSGTHIYNFKNGNSKGFLTIDHSYSPSMSGHETKSKIDLELEGIPDEDQIQVFRSFILPSLFHHLDSHRPDVINFSKTIPHLDDIARRINSSFDISDNENNIVAKRKIDPKISRILSHINKTINTRKGN